MTSGQAALHILALLSSCQDPQRVHALEQTLDLIRILQQKTDEEMAKLGLLGFGGLGVSLSPYPVIFPLFALQRPTGFPKLPCTTWAWTPWPCAWLGRAVPKGHRWPWPSRC